jgi:hypothetical protein
MDEITMDTVLHGDWLKQEVNWTVSKPGVFQVKGLKTYFDFDGCKVRDLIDHLHKPSLAVIIQRVRDRKNAKAVAESLNGSTVHYTQISKTNQIVTPEMAADAIPDDQIDAMIQRLEARKRKVILRKKDQQ